jgi:hypothetical protein
MTEIARESSYRIITRAVQHETEPLVGLLLPGAGDCEYSLDADRLSAGLAANPGAMIVYNQHADALSLIERLPLAPGQVLIEVRQDTKGVLGLCALRKTESGRETLDLVYRE